ncbi:MAG: enoyl-CoA hydratase/isomerase family protein [Pseudolabrys sp.]|nr:enoyl-CoA hydratase/isomerase family protein [Pseudolabrys sp.]
MFSSLIVEKKGTVAWIRLNRPAAANAINAQMRSELAAAFSDAAQDPAVRSIVIRGEGKSFAAGSDVRELSALSPAQSVELSERIARFHAQIAETGKPVIAAIGGWCLGGGFELALACDIRIASQTARFGLPEPTLGLIAGGGGIPRLAKLAGPGVARHMCLTAEIIEANQALARGIVTAVVPADELETAVSRLTDRIAELAPIAVAQIKRVLESAGEANLAGAIAAEAQACALCMATDDYKEGTAAFLEKRKAQFSGY